MQSIKRTVYITGYSILAFMCLSQLNVSYGGTPSFHHPHTWCWTIRTMFVGCFTSQQHVSVSQGRAIPTMLVALRPSNMRVYLRDGLSVQCWLLNVPATCECISGTGYPYNVCWLLYVPATCECISGTGYPYNVCWLLNVPATCECISGTDYQYNVCWLLNVPATCECISGTDYQYNVCWLLNVPATCECISGTDYQYKRSTVTYMDTIAPGPLERTCWRQFAEL